MFQQLLMWFFPKQVLMKGRMVSSEFNEITRKTEAILYSAYAEFEYMDEDEKLFVRFVYTFGFERILSDELVNAPKKTMRQWLRNGLIPCAGEIYFLNYGDAPISVTPLSLTIDETTLTFDQSFDIFPRHLSITPAFESMVINYTTAFEVAIRFEYEGVVKELKGTARRLSVEEIKLKYR